MQRNRAEFLDKERMACKASIAEINVELSEAYKEKDKISGSLNYIYQNYDLDNMEEA